MVVPAQPLGDHEIAGSASLFALRPISPEIITGYGAWNIPPGIPVSIFVQSARQAPWIASAVELKGYDVHTAPLEVLYGVACETMGETEAWHAKPNVVSMEAPGIGRVAVDAVFVAGLAGTELSSCPRAETVTASVRDSAFEWLTFHTEAFKTFAQSYAAVDHLAIIADSVPSETLYARYVQTLEALDSLPALADAVTFELGRVTFGTPIVFSAHEARLQLPRRIENEFSVYVVHLAASLRDIDPSELESMSFNIATRPEALALDLIPLRLEETGSEETAVGISGGVRVGRAEFETTFQRKIVYETARPIIIATGLQEANFSWTVRGNALHQGANRFVVILGVPKGTRRIKMYFSSTVQARSSLFIAGRVARSDTIQADVRLE